MTTSYNFTRNTGAGTVSGQISNNNTLTITYLAGANTWTLTNGVTEILNGTFSGNVVWELVDNTGSSFGTYDTRDETYHDNNLTPIVSNVDTKMGNNYYEEDLTTGIKKYFAEAFSFDGDNFEMDGNRVVGLKQSFVDSLATDLTNIVNTSITTATLTADNATINATLTALGINTDLLKTKDLRLIDDQGHEHKLHLGN